MLNSYQKFINDIWKYFDDKVVHYQNNELGFRIQLTNRAEKGESVKIKEELEEWKRINLNPLQKIGAECLDPILNKFHLKVKTTLEEYTERNAIQICSLYDEKTVPFNKLSTGTKQIIFTAFPIYEFLGKNSIVLMDEPESSLYPDIQKEIIPYYTSLNKEKSSSNQFFFATHSPIIASSFEPWEIVELKFNEQGEIYRELYYPSKEENHVDSYKLDPRYLRWDDILTKIFDLSDDGNADFRLEKLGEFAELKRKIKKLRETGALENPSSETQKILKQFKRSNDLLTGKWASLKHEKN